MSQIDIEKRSQMTSLEVIDYVVAHLKKQKVRSTNGETCQYRGPSGAMCAVGCLITDDEYEAYSIAEGRPMEGFGVACLTSLSVADPLKSFVETHLDVLKTLQHIHDAHPDVPFDNSFIFEQDIGLLKHGL